MADGPDVVAAHGHSSRHRCELEASAHCGCFYCLAVFDPVEIESWLNEGDGTALCPRCGIDSVIGSASGLPITREFLGAMHCHWFNEPPPAE
ncbi:MAG: cytoplasmic protein [Planctomycetes bacterium]|nr:cytoplasmic protein [Planctomycetota bacterium]